MLVAALSLGKWFIGSRAGRSVSFFLLIAAVSGGIWLHGYNARKDQDAADRLKATIEKQQDRIRIDDDVTSASDRELCRRLGGGVQCDEL